MNSHRVVRNLKTAGNIGGNGGTLMGDSLIPNSANAFDEVVSIIDNARESAFRAVMSA